MQRSESHLFWHEHGKGNKPQAAQAIDEDEEDVLFVTYVQFRINFHSFKLRLSLDTDLIHIL